MTNKQQDKATSIKVEVLLLVFLVWNYIVLTIPTFTISSRNINFIVAFLVLPLLASLLTKLLLVFRPKIVNEGEFIAKVVAYSLLIEIVSVFFIIPLALFLGIYCDLSASSSC